MRRRGHISLRSRVRAEIAAGKSRPQAGGRQAWQPCPPAPVLTASTPPWVIPATASNHPRVQLIHAALSKRRRRAWSACGHGCRLTLEHAWSHGLRPRLACCSRNRTRRSPTERLAKGGETSRAASRRGGPFQSREKALVASDRGGLVEYGTAAALPPTLLLRARMSQQP